jgi:hypothetical protein
MYILYFFILRKKLLHQTLFLFSPYFITFFKRKTKYVLIIIILYREVLRNEKNDSDCEFILSFFNADDT